MMQKTAQEFAKTHLEPGVIKRDEMSLFPKEQIKMMGNVKKK